MVYGLHIVDYRPAHTQSNGAYYLPTNRSLSSHPHPPIIPFYLNASIHTADQ